MLVLTVVHVDVMVLVELLVPDCHSRLSVLGPNPLVEYEKYKDLHRLHFLPKSGFIHRLVVQSLFSKRGSNPLSFWVLTQLNTPNPPVTCGCGSKPHYPGDHLKKLPEKRLIGWLSHPKKVPTEVGFDPHPCHPALPVVPVPLLLLVVVVELIELPVLVTLLLEVLLLEIDVEDVDVEVLESVDVLVLLLLLLVMLDVPLVLVDV